MTIKAENIGILKENLHKALENNDFILHYQPKIDVASKKVIGVEALIRWNRPDGMLFPGSFISAIEDSDLIISVSEWVL
jgi:EAL domain-containing protein (putative c-di-GMP-specific phosphodiesterase class I)